jgi:hypothetical protein
MEKLSPEWAVELLRKHGMEITMEQAAAILEFFRKMANIAVTQYLRDEDDNLKKTG